MRKSIALLGAIVGAGAVLYGCGGGEDGIPTSSPGGSGGVSVASYITDAPASQFPVFETTLYSISLCNENGCQPIFSDPDGMTVDLTELRGVMRYLGTAQVPPGTYNRIEVEVASTVNAVDNNGTQYSLTFTDIQTTDVSVSCSQDRCTISINTQVDASAGKVAIDFELDQFQVDTNSGQITGISVRPVDPAQLQNTNQYMMEITGTVQNMGENSITVDVAGRQFTLQITQDTMCKGMGGCGNIQQGWCIEAEVLGDPAQQDLLTAIKIERESHRGCIGEFEIEDDYNEDMYREMKFYVAPEDISLSEGLISINGQEFTVSENTLCEFEVPSQMMGGVMPQSYNERYFMGQECMQNLSSVLENAQPGMMLEVELEVSNDNVVLELEVSLEDDYEEENEDN